MEREKIRVTVEVPGNKADSLMGDTVLMVAINDNNARTYAASHGTKSGTLLSGASIGIAGLIRDICEQTGTNPELFLIGIGSLL